VRLSGRPVTDALANCAPVHDPWQRSGRAAERVTRLFTGASRDGPRRAHAMAALQRSSVLQLRRWPRPCVISRREGELKNPLDAFDGDQVGDETRVRAMLRFCVRRWTSHSGGSAPYAVAVSQRPRSAFGTAGGS